MERLRAPSAPPKEKALSPAGEAAVAGGAAAPVRWGAFFGADLLIVYGVGVRGGVP